MSYAKMMGTMRRNPHCFGAGHDIVFPDDTKCNDGKGCGALEECVNGKCGPQELGRRPSPSLRLRTPATSRGNQFPGGGKKKPALTNRPPMPGRRRGLSPMQRRNEQGLRKVKAR